MGTPDKIYTVDEERAYNKGYRDAAKQILDDIKKEFGINRNSVIIIFNNEFANLEKKYIKSEGNK